MMVVMKPRASEAEIAAVVERIETAGATMVRGGAYEPRTSPYSFQGLGVEEAREQTGLPIVTELMDARDLEAVAEVADVIRATLRATYARKVEAAAAVAGKKEFIAAPA